MKEGITEQSINVILTLLDLSTLEQLEQIQKSVKIRIDNMVN